MDDFFSGPIVVTWRKLSQYVIERRIEAERETYFEWVQWLAESHIVIIGFEDQCVQLPSKTPWPR